MSGCIIYVSPLCIKKKQVALDNANKANAESQKQVTKLKQLIGEHHSGLEDQERQKAELREAAVAAERRCTSLLVEVDEFRSEIHYSSKLLLLLLSEMCNCLFF